MRILGHRSSRLLLSVALAAGVCPACAGTDEDVLGAETPDPEDLEGATDSFFRPTEHGDLRLGSQEGVHATLAPDAGYHAWFFDVPGDSPDATSRIALATDRDDREGPGSGKELDTVLYLYRQDDDGGWGRYLAKNDDRDTSTRFSELSERELAPGRYRVIVKGARECGRRAGESSPYCGSFALTSLCLSGAACAVEGPTPSDCEGFDGALDECRGLHAEPFDVCLELGSIARADLLACCEADDTWTFCPVPEPVDPAVLERCQGWATEVVDCESAGHDVEQCGREHGFTRAELAECCEADDVFYFCSLG